MQIETTMKYHLTPVRMAVINKSTNSTCWRGCGEKWNLCALLVAMLIVAATMKRSRELP